MKQKHIFYCKVLLDTSDNHVCFNVIQGIVKKEVDNHYVVFENGHDHWIHKNFLSKIKPVFDTQVKDDTDDDFHCWTMGFVWTEDDDEHYISYLAAECQRRCKHPVLEYFNALRAEIDKQERKLMSSIYLLKH